MTQQELAGRELTRGFISQLEKGIVLPSLKSLELIASRLGKPLAYFLEDGAQPAPLAPEESRTQLLQQAEHHLFAGEVEPAARALARAREEPPQPWSSREAGRIELLEGRLAWRQGHLAVARQRLCDAIEKLRAAGDFAWVAVALADLGELTLVQGQAADAAPLLDEALRLAGRHGLSSPHEMLRLRVLAAIAASRAGRPQAAQQAVEAALAMQTQTGWCYRPGDLLVALGSAHLQAGELARARAVLERAVEWSETLQQPEAAGWAYRLLARASLAEGQGGDPVELLEKALASFQQARDARLARDVTVELVRALAEAGQLERALSCCGEALKRWEQAADRLPLLQLAGRLLQRAGRDQEARRHLEEAVHLAGQVGHPRELAGALSELGNLLRRLGEHALAGEYLARAVSLYASAETG